MSATLITARRARPISLTALIDVVFILLMFFMLTSSFSHLQELPLLQKTSGANSKSTQTQQFLLLLEPHTVASVIDGQRGAASPLAVAIKDVDRNQTLTLIPDGDLSLQDIVGTIDALRAAGVSQIALGESSPL